MNNHKLNGNLEVARGEIDRLDDELMQVLAARMQMSREIGQLKNGENGSRLWDSVREQKLLSRWKKSAQESGLSGHFAGRLLKEVLRYSRQEQEAEFKTPTSESAQIPTVAYQGEPHCFSDMAAEHAFETRSSQGCNRLGFQTFAEAIAALRHARVDYALLPAENSIAGSIGEVGQLLADSDLHIVGEEVWEVEHVLAVPAGQENEAITCVRSHPVALAQCGEFLSRLPELKLEPWPDTAGAAASLKDPHALGVAAIVSEEAAIAHNLTIVQRDVADQDKNITRFLLLSREEEIPPINVSAKTSLLLSLDHKRGALAKVLTIFAARSINLTRIESRPDPKVPWQYRFFADLQGHCKEESVREALAEVAIHCNHLRVLGTYPMRAQEEEHLARSPQPPVIKAKATKTICKTKIIDVAGVPFGGKQFPMILGPCAVESSAQIHKAAEMVKAAGACMLRGGAFKPRTSPHSFQGLGLEGLRLLKSAGQSAGLPVVTEVMTIEDLDAVAHSADMIQVGARNMQNFSLLRAIGRVNCPVLLKRGLSATVDELLSAAEYITAGGNQRIVLCERGIRTFETSTRSTLDLGAVAVLKSRTHFPVIVDPSHAAGVRNLVIPLALAATAAGADGLIVEAHPDPESAKCDKEQALTAGDLTQLFDTLRPILTGQGRRL